MDEETLIIVEVAYAKSHEQVIVALKVPENSTVETAIKASGLLTCFPEINLSEAKAGIFGRVCKLDQTVGQGDRIEIYRPLVNDPKEARRRRAAKI
jgi:putative ubiquitin-RnfH superfamily antitoxin RatB of RatAB toxin-antitoxin module